MSNIDGIIWSLSPEYENALLFLSSLEKLNDFDACTGIWLDRLGQLVCMSRQQAGAMIGSRELADDDDIYRICLKYKAFVNSCRCTPDEIIEATKIIFGATQVVYSERRDVPATIFLSVSAPFPIWCCLFWAPMTYRTPGGCQSPSELLDRRCGNVWLCRPESASCGLWRGPVCAVYQLTGGKFYGESTCRVCFGGFFRRRR